MKPRSMLLGRVFLGLSAAIAGFGCSRGTPAAAPPPADPMAGAPADPLELLTWAEARLSEPVASVPVPVRPKLPKPKWALVRLADPRAVDIAEIATTWKEPEQGPEVLAEVGPFRTSDPQARGFNVELRQRATPEGDDALMLAVRGFRVQREDVGTIELTMSVPFGRTISLIWSKAGQITIPLAKVGESFTVRVPTDGLAEWSGPLDAVQFQTERVEPGVVAIEKIRFLPRVSSYPESRGVTRAQLRETSRDAVYLHANATLTYNAVALPANAKFAGGLGFVAGGGGDTAGGRFVLRIGEQEPDQVVFDRRVESANAWHEVSAPLAEWAGRRVKLALTFESDAPNAVGFWANPIVYEPDLEAPVFVLYLIDTLCGDHIGFYGHPRETMPRLRAEAQQGAWFGDMRSNSSRTIESIPDMMLSMPTERHGVHHNSTPAPRELVTLAEVLRAAGFATVSYCTNVNAGPRQGMDQGFDQFVDQIGYFWSNEDEADRTVPLELTEEWMRVHADRPMFIYVHTAEPHAPYTPKEGFKGRFDPDYDGIVTGTYHGEHGFMRVINPRNVAQKQRDLQHVVALYDEEILYADSQLGKFLDQLAAAELTPRATVFVTADHGEEFLQHGQWEHGVNVFKEQLSVPLVMFGRGIASRGDIAFAGQTMDIMPTVLDMYGLPQPYPLDGRSLWPLVRRSEAGLAAAAAISGLEGAALAGAPPERLLFISNHNYRVANKLIEYAVVEPGKWKLIYGARPFPVQAGGPASRFVLFDLQKDPGERENVIGAQPDVARRLIAELLAWRLAHPPYERSSGSYEMGGAESKQLQGLGYIGGDRPEEE